MIKQFKDIQEYLKYVKSKRKKNEGIPTITEAETKSHSKGKKKPSGKEKSDEIQAK